MVNISDFIEKTKLAIITAFIATFQMAASQYPAGQLYHYQVGCIDQVSYTLFNLGLVKDATKTRDQIADAVEEHTDLVVLKDILMAIK